MRQLLGALLLLGGLLLAAPRAHGQYCGRSGATRAIYRASTTVASTRPIRTLTVGSTGIRSTAGPRRTRLTVGTIRTRQFPEQLCVLRCGRLLSDPSYGAVNPLFGDAVLGPADDGFRVPRAAGQHRLLSIGGPRTMAAGWQRHSSRTRLSAGWWELREHANALARHAVLRGRLFALCFGAIPAVVLHGGQPFSTSTVRSAGIPPLPPPPPVKGVVADVASARGPVSWRGSLIVAAPSASAQYCSNGTRTLIPASAPRRTSIRRTAAAIPGISTIRSSSRGMAKPELLR